MCGIFGMISAEGTTQYQKRKGFLKDAAVVDSIRGMDSTGIFGIRKKGHSKEMYKKDVAGHDFIQLTRPNNMFMNTDHYAALVGHNRAATIGSVSSETAHPFTFGHITGVHNGTLKNHWQALPSAGVSVDSARLFKGIEEKGAEEVFKKVNGSFACVWWDAKKDRLYALRNSDRPLHFATVKKEKTVLFASEKGMLMWLAARNKIEVEQVYALKEGVMMEFDLEDPCNPKDHKMELYSPPKSNSTNKWANRGNGTRPAKSRKAGIHSYSGPDDVVVGDTVAALAARVSAGDEELLAGSELLAGEVCTVWLTDDGDFEPWPSMKKAAVRGSCTGLAEIMVSKDMEPLYRNVRVMRIPEEVYINYASIVAAAVSYGPLTPGGAMGPLFQFMRPDQLVSSDEETAEILSSLEHEDDSEEAGAILLQGPGGQWMTEEEIEKHLKKHSSQCQSCSADLFASYDIIQWVASDTGDVPLCEDCTMEGKKSNVIQLPATKQTH